MREQGIGVFDVVHEVFIRNPKKAAIAPLRAPAVHDFKSTSSFVVIIANDAHSMTADGVGIEFTVPNSVDEVFLFFPASIVVGFEDGYNGLLVD